MPRVSVTMIESIAGSVVTTDGCHAVLEARTVDGIHVALGIPRDQIAPLIDHCAYADAQCERVLRSNAAFKTAVGWWDSALDPASGEFVLKLTFGRGGTLSFGLSEHMAKALLTTLRDRFEGDAPDVVFKDRTCADSSMEEALEPGFI